MKCVVLFFLASIIFAVRNCLDFEHFSSNSECDNMVLDNFETFQTVQTNSKLGCARICLEQEDCASINFISGLKECQLNSGVILTGCSNAVVSTDGVYFKRNSKAQGCLHKGTPAVGESYECNCVDGYTGNRCERLLTSCREGNDIPYYAEQYLEIYILPSLAPKPIFTNCRMVYGGRNIIAYHYDPYYTFNRTWDEYKKGFGQSPQQNWWTGLENLHYLTNSESYDFCVQLKENSAPLYRSNCYTNFRIANETEGFRIMSLTPKYNSFSWCFTFLINLPFSTFDRPANPSVNCASLNGAGWWFDNLCGPCNPFGDLKDPPGGTRIGVPNEIFWNGMNWSPLSINMWLE